MTLKIEAILHRPSYFILEPQQHSGWCNAVLMPNTAFCRLWFGDYTNLSKFGWLFVTFLTAWTWTYNDSFEGILWGSLLGACSYAPQMQLVFQWDWKDDWLKISLNPEDSKVVWRNWSGHASYSEIWAPRKLDDIDINVSDQICHCLFSGHAQGVSFSQYLKSCIACSTDSYLDELQKQLEDVCHVKVAMSTIWRALKQQGFTMKRVRQWYVYWTIIQALNMSTILDYKSGFRAKRELTTQIHLLNGS